MNSNIAIVTIGQAPRKDMADDILQLKKGWLTCYRVWCTRFTFFF